MRNLELGKGHSHKRRPMIKQKNIFDAEKDLKQLAKDGLIKVKKAKKKLVKVPGFNPPTWIEIDPKNNNPEYFEAWKAKQMNSAKYANINGEI